MTMADIASNETLTHGKDFVRSFLFSVKIDSPLARLHVLTKLIAVLALSFVIVRFIDTESPDPIGALLLILLSFLGLHLSGVLRWVFRSYLIVFFPALVGMALTWVVFYPDPGRRVFARFLVYPGYVNLGLSLGFVVFLGFALVWYLWRKELFWGIAGGIALALLITTRIGNPTWSFGRTELFHPLTVIVSDKNVIAGVTKALGYGAMIFTSLMLVMTTRDIELTGSMMQLRVPYVASFFVSTMLRSLSLALSDYTTINQAQIARGVSLNRKDILHKIADFAYMAVPLTATMLRRSREVGDAVLIRGFTMQTRNPTEYRETRPFTRADLIVLGIGVVIVVAVFVFRLNITAVLGVIP